VQLRDFGVTASCKNPDAVHICCQCNACGRFAGKRVPTPEEVDAWTLEGADPEEIRRHEFEQAECAGQGRLL
jgi:hypothetical protein